MKRFIGKTAITIIPVLIGIFFCEHFLRKIPNDYAYKNEWLTNNISSVQVLIMGSSHSYFGINPTCFSEHAFNASHVSQTLKYDYYIFNKFYNQMDSLRILILPVSYGSLVDFGPERGIEDWRAKYYSIYYGCEYHKFEPNYNYEIYNKHHLKMALNSMLGKENHRACDSLGRGFTGNLEDRPKNWEESGRIAARRHTSSKINHEIVEKNKFLIEEIINKCREKNVFVVIVTTPTYQSYWENLDTYQLNLMIEICNSYAEKHTNVKYLNLLSDERFGPDDFSDADHLNEFGAEKLSRVLNDYCNSLVFQK